MHVVPSRPASEHELGKPEPKPGEHEPGKHEQWVERALARERRLARAGHWSYSINRHLALREELDRLRGVRREPRPMRRRRPPPRAGRPRRG